MQLAPVIVDGNQLAQRHAGGLGQNFGLCLCVGAGAIQQGGIDTAGLKNLEYLYKSYHALGGNGTGTELYNRAKALPIRD